MAQFIQDGAWAQAGVPAGGAKTIEIPLAHRKRQKSRIAKELKTAVRSLERLASITSL
jgi:hypothetical protein